MSDIIDLGPIMSAEELVKLRKTIGLNQTEMAASMGMSKSALVAVETGVATMRRIHQLAAERIAIAVAAARAEIGDKLPPSLRQDIVEAAKTISR